jgi:hypothetical protein
VKDFGIGGIKGYAAPKVEWSQNACGSMWLSKRGNTLFSSLAVA